VDHDGKKCWEVQCGVRGREGEVMRRNPRSRRGTLDVRIISSIEIGTNIFDL
jgi:hypothetical protein